MPIIPRKEDKSPTIKLAHVPGAQGDNVLKGRNGVDQLPIESRPALLVSYYYLTGFLENQHRYAYRNWMMDSGAYSAWNSGAEIDIDSYIEVCKVLLERDPTLLEIIALDVIGSGEKSQINAHYMKDKGINAIPVFHIGDDWDILKDYCANWDKVGLSCLFGEPLEKSYWFYDQCFARAWPKKFHSFGWASEKMLMRFPFHSSDSTSWEMAPVAYGRWKAFGGQNVSVRGSAQNLRAEVEWWLELERKLQERWKKEMKLLDELSEKSELETIPRPSIHLATAIMRDTQIEGRLLQAFGKEGEKSDIMRDAPEDIERLNNKAHGRGDKC